MNHHTSIALQPSPADTARQGGREDLAQALVASRRDTLATFAAFQTALPRLLVPCQAELNPPLWELGHVGWFQAHWTTGHAQLLRGWDADPEVWPAADDDVLYDSSRVPHDARWHLPLPDAQATLERLRHQLTMALEALEALPDDSPRALYFHRLALFHEDMHHEAALYMAQQLGFAITDTRWQRPTLPTPGSALHLDGGPLCLGGDMAAGFRFDNECGEQRVTLAPFEIDAQVLSWADYLPFVEAGGPMPRYLRRAGPGWEEWHHGNWSALDPRGPACHLSAVEAQAWCVWAGRRLPTEAEWVCAQQAQPTRFRWGQVWEWTDSSFAPFPGFQAHPYRDYSLPWFDGRPVLKGASYLTQPRMRHPDYRNFFPATRNDIAAGLRSCAR